MEINRCYLVERDDTGMPTRLIWAGDVRRMPVYLTCPTCPTSPPLVQGRCLTCWGDWRRASRIGK